MKPTRTIAFRLFSAFRLSELQNFCAPRISALQPFSLSALLLLAGLSALQPFSPSAFSAAATAAENAQSGRLVIIGGGGTTDAIKERMLRDAGGAPQARMLVVSYADMKEGPKTVEAYRKFAKLRIDAVNHALAGIPEERVRYHLCWGSWHGPHTDDLPLELGLDLIEPRANGVE